MITSPQPVTPIIFQFQVETGRSLIDEITDIETMAKQCLAAGTSGRSVRIGAMALLHSAMENASIQIGARSDASRSDES